MFYRQGDVGILRVSAVPSNVSPEPLDSDGSIVLAWGEITGHRHRIQLDTGHCHAIVDEAANLVREAQTNRRFLRVMAASGVKLRHEEHATVTLPPGDYEIIQQVEYVPQELPRAVMD